MPSKRDADAAGLEGPRRSTRRRPQQTTDEPEALHKSNAATTTTAAGVGYDEFADELGMDDPVATPTPLQKPTTSPKDPGQKVKEPGTTAAGPTSSAPGTTSAPEPDQAPPPEPDAAATDESKPPEYIKTYQYFTNGLRCLTGWSELRKDDEGKDNWVLHNGDIIDQLCDPFFTFDIKLSKEETLRTLGRMDETAARIIDYVAQGGPNGRHDWYELFRDNETRKHVVYAVLGLIMKDFVFGSLCYGADNDQIRILHRDVDVKYCDFPYDGFIRTRIRGKRIEKLWAKNPAYMRDCFVRQSKILAWQTYEIIAPILALHPDADTLCQQRQQQVLRVLFTLITRAGILSRDMRLDRQTIYRMTVPHKEDYHLERDTHVLNEETMNKTNRFHNATWPEMPGMKSKKWSAAVLDAALVRIAAFPGFVAYKRGGWKAPDKDNGVRVAEISKRVVALRWGNESPWPGEKGAWREWLSVWRAERAKPLPIEPTAPLDDCMAILRSEAPFPAATDAPAMLKRVHEAAQAMQNLEEAGPDLDDEMKAALEKRMLHWTVSLKAKQSKAPMQYSDAAMKAMNINPEEMVKRELGWLARRLSRVMSLAAAAAAANGS